MILVFGGAYQGKQDFVKEHFGISDAGIFHCSNEVDISYKVICNLEEFLLFAVKNNWDTAAFIEESLPALEDKIIVMTDISNGIVPMDPLLRKWREETARAMTALSRNSEEVYRVYCGIATKLK